MRSPDRKSEREEDGGKGVRSSGGIQAPAPRRGQRSNGVGIIANVEISKEVVRVEMAREDHCSMDDCPPTNYVCHLRLRTPDG